MIINPVLDELDNMSAPAKAALAQAHQQTVAQLAPPPAALNQPAPGIQAAPAATAVADQPLPQMAPPPAAKVPTLGLGPDMAASQAHQQELGRLTTGDEGKSGIAQIKSPWARIPLQIADAIGGAFVPGLEQRLPGTEGHHQVLVNHEAGLVKQDEAAANEAQQRGLQAANTAHTQELTTEMPELNAAKNELATTKQELVGQKQTETERNNRAKDSAGLAGRGLIRDETGAIVEDPDSPITHKNQVSSDLMSAQQELVKAKTELARSANDPNSPKYQMDLRRMATAERNSQAATERATAYWGNYLLHSEGTDLHGAPVNGIGMLGNAPVGTTAQANVSKTLPKHAQFADVHAGLDHLDSALETLEKQGGSLNSAKMAAALADHHTTSAEWLQGKVKSTLSPAERDAVVATKAMQERIMAMRASAGGGVSDAQVNRLQQLLPNASTPDLDTARRQLKEVRSQAETLESGIPQIYTKGAPQSGTQHFVVGGKEYNIPAEKVAAFKKAKGLQ